jgi:uncharacterized membrane protein YgdD (TMEM256/DUF423 family)
LDRIFLAIGAASAFFAVAAGAFGAHALKSRLSSEMLDIFEVGVRYQMYHALALFAVAWVCSKWPESYATTAGWLFVADILSLTGARWLGAITPLGGVAFLGGWALLIWTALKG